MVVFNEKVAIITGSASGIGKALAELLAKKGKIVIVADRDVTNGEVVASTITKEGGKASFHYLDVTDEKMVHDLLQEVYEQYGRIDFMFNNAGISSMREFFDLTSEHWKKMIDVNLLGVIYGSTAAYNLMRKQGHGYIINTASAAAFGPAPLTSAYGATKQAVLGLTTSLHYEAEEYGVKVSAVCPAFVKTPISQTMDMSDFDREVFSKNQRNYITSEKCAEIILKGLRKEKLIITTLGFKKTTDFIFMLFPGLHRQLIRFVVKTGRRSKLTS
ncbi:SDR family NAD(P)-dependent oxidoreductase [Fredinandcohnia humi]